MAYARWSNSDLYVYLHVDGFFVCENCHFYSHDQDELLTFNSTTAIVTHVQTAHPNAALPDSFLTDLEMDREFNDAWIADRTIGNRGDVNLFVDLHTYPPSILRDHLSHINKETTS